MAEILGYKKIKTHFKVLKHSQWSLSLNPKNAYEIRTCSMNVRNSSGPMERNVGDSRITEVCASYAGWCTQRSIKEKPITNKVGTKKWHPDLFSDFISMLWQAWVCIYTYKYKRFLKKYFEISGHREKETYFLQWYDCW